MISPLRYPGGKAKLYPFFVELIRLNELYDCRYIEPYAGGAGLALKLLSHGFVASIEINDIDPAITSFWRSILGSTDQFCDKISDVELSVDEWRRQREIYSAGASSGEFNLGFATYYLNRTSRSGIIEGSGPIGGYEQNGNWKIDARFNREAQIRQIKEIERFSSVVNVSNLDAIEFYESRIGSAKTLTYLDPPYYVKGQKLYKNFYKHDDHVLISKFLNKYRENSWVLSYDYASEIVAMYEQFDPIVYELPYSAGPAGSGNEVIFSGRSLRLPTLDFLPRAA